MNWCTSEEIYSHSEKEENGRFASIVSVLKKRKEHKDQDKRRRVTISGGVDNEKFKF